MAEKTYDLSLEANLGLIHMQAKFGHKWALMNHVNVEYDDMFQEASIAFMLAAEGYDPDTGLKFSAYYTKVAFSQFKKTIGIMSGVKNLNADQRADIAHRREENDRRARAGQARLPAITYGLRPVNFSEVQGQSDEGDFDPFVDRLESDELTPEQILEFRQEWDHLTSQLSPMAKMVLEWLRDPPPELARELAAQEALAVQATTRGDRLPPRGLRDGLTLKNIGRFLSMLGGERAKAEFAAVQQELLNLITRLEAA